MEGSAAEAADVTSNGYLWPALRAAVAGGLAAVAIDAIRTVLAHPERLGLCSDEGFNCLGYGLLGLAVTPFAAWLVCWLLLKAVMVPRAALVATLGGTCTYLVLVAAARTGVDMRPTLAGPVLAISFAASTLLTPPRPAAER